MKAKKGEGPWGGIQYSFKGKTDVGKNGSGINFKRSLKTKPSKYLLV